MKSITTSHAALFLSLTLALGATVACSDEDPAGSNSNGGDGDSTAEDPGGDDPQGGEGDDPATPGNGAGGAGNMAPMPVDPLFAVTTQVYDGTDYTSYVVLTDSMGAGELSLDDGIEIAGRSLGVGPNEGGALFVSNGPELTRYDLNEDDELIEGATISFLPAGLSSIGEYQGQFQFVSESKAYFFDGSTGQILVWNPKEMTFIKSISLAELVHADELLTFGGAPVIEGDKIMAFPGWRSADNTRVIARSAVVTLDTSTDTVAIDVDERCGYTRDGVLADDGMLYLATEAFASAVYHYNTDNAPAPCLIRFDTDSGSFDSSFQTDLTTVFDGAVAGTLLTGPDNEAYILTLDFSGYEGPPVPRVLASSPVWNWAALSLGDAPVVELLDADADVADVQPVTSPGSILPSLLGDELYLPLLEGRDATHFHRLGNNGPEVAGANVAGISFSSVKLK